MGRISETFKRPIVWIKNLFDPYTVEERYRRGGVSGTFSGGAGGQENDLKRDNCRRNPLQPNDKHDIGTSRKSKSKRQR